MTPPPHSSTKFPMTIHGKYGYLLNHKFYYTSWDNFVNRKMQWLKDETNWDCVKKHFQIIVTWDPAPKDSWKGSLVLVISLERSQHFWPPLWVQPFFSFLCEVKQFAKNNPVTLKFLCNIGPNSIIMYYVTYFVCIFIVDVKWSYVGQNWWWLGYTGTLPHDPCTI